jgi:hypothetical protein
VWLADPGDGARSMMLANRETQPKLVPLWGQICDECQEKKRTYAKKQPENAMALYLKPEWPA